MRYGRTIELGVPYEEVLPRVRAAFQEQGFERLTEIDLRQTLEEELGQEMEDYVILGACHPRLASRALEIDRAIGMVLPCNVVVRRAGAGRTVVQALDPDVLVRVPERSSLAPIAEEARRRIDAALGTLVASPVP
jgi:uncharacterized protein (DUF302 family)